MRYDDKDYLEKKLSVKMYNILTKSLSSIMSCIVHNNYYSLYIMKTVLVFYYTFARIFTFLFPRSSLQILYPMNL